MWQLEQTLKNYHLMVSHPLQKWLVVCCSHPLRDYFLPTLDCCGKDFSPNIHFVMMLFRLHQGSKFLMIRTLSLN